MRHVPDVQWIDCGARTSFGGTVVTARCFEDNSVVKRMLATPGDGKILVVDGGGSLGCALLGDMIAKDAVDHGWEGVIIFDAVRGRTALATMDIGIKALGTTPRKSVRHDIGDVDNPLEIGGVAIHPDGSQRRPLSKRQYELRERVGRGHAELFRLVAGGSF